jgi:hypothetical protein
MALPDYIERNFISNKEAHKENIVGCSGVGQAMVWQVREAWTDRQHESADAMLYVIGGAGTLRLDGRDVTLAAGSFAVVPRGTGYGFTPRGRNPLIVLAFLAGAPCTGNSGGKETTRIRGTRRTARRLRREGSVELSPEVSRALRVLLRAFVVSFLPPGVWDTLNSSDVCQTRM